MPHDLSVQLPTIGADTWDAVQGGLSSLWSALGSGQTKQVFENLNQMKQFLNPWMQKELPKRLEDLSSEIEKREASGERVKLTEAELGSPQSGVSRIYRRYLVEPLPEKVEILRNALLLGCYGDYTIDTREDLCETVLQLQPSDIHLLKYIVSVCPSETELSKIYQAQERRREELSLKLENREISSTEHKALNLEAQQPYKEVSNKLQFEAIQTHFPQMEEIVIKRALERLERVGLVYNLTINTWGRYRPYGAFGPTDYAQRLLGFVLDPRNK